MAPKGSQGSGVLLPVYWAGCAAACMASLKVAVRFPSVPCGVVRAGASLPASEARSLTNCMTLHGHGSRGTLLIVAAARNEPKCTRPSIVAVRWTCRVHVCGVLRVGYVCSGQGWLVSRMHGLPRFAPAVQHSAPPPGRRIATAKWTGLCVPTCGLQQTGRQGDPCSLFPVGCDHSLSSVAAWWSWAGDWAGVFSRLKGCAVRHTPLRRSPWLGQASYSGCAQQVTRTVGQ